MSEATFSQDAEADLLDIAEFIARDNPMAAREWVDAVRQRCHLLSQHPLMGESRPGFGVAGCRSISVGLYVIFFRPSASGVEIARILHGSRDLGR
ncbi:MAG: type II toxin-antitoxin system RelE/ParE family toxin [Planctomycetota bacterium]